MSRGKRSFGEREALDRDCPTCHTTAGDWCTPLSRMEAASLTGWDQGLPDLDATRLHLARMGRLTSGQVGDYLRVTRVTVVRAAEAGVLPGVKDRGNGWWSFQAGDVAAFLAARTEERTA
jgi:hypothetical protein